jgi:predicted nucleotidyltransferase
MMEDKTHIVKEIRTILSAELDKDEIKDIVFFGSQLGNNSTEDSDYDILILTRQTPDWKTERKISDLLFSIELKYNVLIDAHILGENELEQPRGKQPVFINAINNGIYI